MSAPDKIWNEKTAQVYDFFSAITTFYARHALDVLKQPIAAAGEAATVLDNAAGTGAVALEVAREFPNVKVLGTDVSRPQLDVAVGKAADLGLNNVEFKVMDGQALELENDSMDAVVCQFGLMFFPDKAKGWSEMHRVLKPGGTAVVATWSQPVILPQLEEAYTELMGEAEAKKLPAFNVPRVLKDPESLRSGAESAGFTAVKVYPLEFSWKAWPKDENEEMVGHVMSMPVVAQVVPEGQEAKFKELLTKAMLSLVDEAGMVTLSCIAMIAVAQN